VPTRSRLLEPPRLLVERQQQRQGVREWNARELRRLRLGQQKVPPVESAFELAVRAPLGSHEQSSHQHHSARPVRLQPERGRSSENGWEGQ